MRDRETVKKEEGREHEGRCDPNETLKDKTDESSEKGRGKYYEEDEYKSDRQQRERQMRKEENEDR